MPNEKTVTCEMCLHDGFHVQSDPGWKPGRILSFLGVKEREPVLILTCRVCRHQKSYRKNEIKYIETRQL